MSPPTASEPIDAALRPAVSAWWLPLFLLLPLWATWPLARHATTHLPLGEEPTATVPLFNLWTIWWNADRAQHGLRGYWQAPIFHPAENTFAFSEPQPTTIAVAPAVWFSETPILAYNLYLLANLTLNGWVAARLFGSVYGRRFPAILGGAMVQVLPFVYWQLDVLQLAPLWGIVWTLGAVWKFGSEPRMLTGVWAGLAFGVTYLLCNHYGLFLSVLVIPAGLVLLGRNLGNRRTWTKLLPGAAVGVLLIASMAVVQIPVSREQEWQRDGELVRQLSAEWGDYTAPPWPQLLPIGDLADANRRAWWPMSPGYLKMLLAVVGIIGGLCMRGRRRWTVACALIAGLSAVLSLGPKFTLGPLVPYDWLVDWYPGFAQVRNVFRFAVFVQLLVVFLACGGLAVLADVAEWLSRRFVLRPAPLSVWRNRVNGILPVTLVALVGAACVFEIRPPDRALYAVPSLDDNRGWIAWLRDETRPEDVIAAVPFSPGGHVAYYQQTTVWMYWGTFHGRRMVNGYSGFHPEQHVELQWAMAWFPDDRSLRMLHDRGVAYCVVRRERPGTPLAERMRKPPRELVPVFHDNRAGIDIYRLQMPSRIDIPPRPNPNRIEVSP